MATRSRPNIEIDEVLETIMQEGCDYEPDLGYDDEEWDDEEEDENPVLVAELDVGE